jgi:hypothetical protein
MSWEPPLAAVRLNSNRQPIVRIGGGPVGRSRRQLPASSHLHFFEWTLVQFIGVCPTPATLALSLLFVHTTPPSQAIHNFAHVQLQHSKVSWTPLF